MPKVMPTQKPGVSKQEYGTPPEFLVAAARWLGIEAFGFDLAASPSNAVAVDYFSADTDALVHDWPRVGWCWLNPEFADIDPWVKKAYMQSRLGSSVAVLVPASSGANWWKLWVDQKARVLQLNGRIRFVGESDPYVKDCALLLYGPTIEPGYEVWSWMDELTEDERKTMRQTHKKAKKDNVSEFKKSGRKPRTVDVAAMAATSEQVAVHRLLEAYPDLRPTPEVVLPEPADAVRLLGELATLNDQALAAGKVYEDLKDRTKTAKEKYDELAERVLTRLRVGTHASDLPLFNLDEREADQRRMEEARIEGAQDAAQEVTGASPDSEAAGVGPVYHPSPENASQTRL